MTINPLTGEYTHTDLTTLRTRFESLLESGPVFMTWRHLQTPDGTHLDTATTEHPHLAACFQAATQLANGESIYSILFASWDIICHIVYSLASLHVL